MSLDRPYVKHANRAHIVHNQGHQCAPNVLLVPKHHPLRRHYAPIVRPAHIRPTMVHSHVKHARRAPINHHPAPLPVYHVMPENIRQDRAPLPASYVRPVELVIVLVNRHVTHARPAPMPMSSVYRHANNVPLVDLVRVDRRPYARLVQLVNIKILMHRPRANHAMPVRVNHCRVNRSVSLALLVTRNHRRVNRRVWHVLPVNSPIVPHRSLVMDVRPDMHSHRPDKPHVWHVPSDYLPVAAVYRRAHYVNRAPILLPMVPSFVKNALLVIISPDSVKANAYHAHVDPSPPAHPHPHVSLVQLAHTKIILHKRHVSIVMRAAMRASLVNRSVRPVPLVLLVLAPVNRCANHVRLVPFKTRRAPLNAMRARRDLCNHCHRQPRASHVTLDDMSLVLD